MKVRLLHIYDVQAHATFWSCLLVPTHVFGNRSAKKGFERLKRWSGRKKIVPLVGGHFFGYKPGTILWVHPVPFVDIHPSGGYRFLARLSAFLEWHFRTLCAGALQPTLLRALALPWWGQVGDLKSHPNELGVHRDIVEGGCLLTHLPGWRYRDLEVRVFRRDTSAL